MEDLQRRRIRNQGRGEFQIVDSSEYQIRVAGLWKVFGDSPERALAPDHSSKSRSEIQEELGLVVGLRDISFKVRAGEIFVIMGLSGSGKSTLVRCLTRLIESTEGQIEFDGEDILEYTQEELIDFRRHKVAMVFQSYGLLPHRSVLDNVAYGLEIQGMDRAERYRVASEAIETVGLSGWEAYYPREMSGGMQQRVGLARALAVNSPALLMDEPFSGLDPLIRREMQDELISLQTELHKTIVFITHDLDEALKLGDTIVILRDGEIAQQGSPQDIVSSPADDYVAEFVKDVSRSKVIQAKSVLQECASVVGRQQGPGDALDAIQQTGGGIAFIVENDHTLVGSVTLEHCTLLAGQGVTTLSQVPVELPTSVTADAYLDEIVPLAAHSEHPIAVTDSEGRLVGEIHRGTLLAGLSERSLEV